MNSKMKSFCLSPPEQQQQHQLEVIDKRVNKIFKKPFGIQIRYRKKTVEYIKNLIRKFTVNNHMT